MGALGHFFEEAGLATTQVSLVRLHSEKARPPRALWVPFELGRPVGPPNDAPFQRRVLKAALELLVTADRPGAIADFPADAPDQAGEPGWTPSFPLPPAGFPADAAEADSRIEAELAALEAAYEAAQARTGYTTARLMGLGPAALARFVAGFLGPEWPDSPRPELSAPVALRFACDDLRAIYLEAAASGPGRPGARQLNDWFWHQTSAARVLFQLRARLKDSADRRAKAVGANLLLPGHRVAPLAAEKARAG